MMSGFSAWTSAGRSTTAFSTSVPIWGRITDPSIGSSSFSSVALRLIYSDTEPFPTLAEVGRLSSVGFTLAGAAESVTRAGVVASFPTTSESSSAF